jgi:tetratricopeptide (TPR) repeat protein
LQRAKELAPDDASVAARINAAQVQRREFAQRCNAGDDGPALAACEAALLENAPDEFDLTRRIAILQQSRNQPSQALDAFMAANKLRRGDRSVALAIVALTDSTGRKDAAALAARGSSLLTLGRAREAAAALRQAQTLAPGLPGLGAQLAAAEQRARQERPEIAPEAGSAATAVQTANVVPPRTYSNAASATRTH